MKLTSSQKQAIREAREACEEMYATQLEQARADSKRLDWLETNVFRAVDLLKCLPLTVGASANIRAAIDKEGVAGMSETGDLSYGDEL